MRRRADAQKKENERLKQILEGYQKSPAETGNGAFGKENPESAQRNASLMGISLPEYQAMGGQAQKIAKEHARLKLELEVLRNEKIDRTFDCLLYTSIGSQLSKRNVPCPDPKSNGRRH